MTFDSTARGFLAPVVPGPAEDADLDLLIQPVIAGISGLDGHLVSRKWQETPPQQPDRGVTWCAFGVSVTGSAINADLVHDGQADRGRGVTHAYRTEDLEVTASFYGPTCRSIATTLRDGFGIGQNRDELRARGLAFVSIERMTLVPELTNQQFIRRADLVMRLRRLVKRTYRVRNFGSLKGVAVADAQSNTGPTILGDKI